MKSRALVYFEQQILPLLLVSHKTHNLLRSKYRQIGSTLSKSTNQRAAFLQPATKCGFGALSWSHNAKNAKHRPKTCNETMLRHNLRVFVSRISPISTPELFCAWLPGREGLWGNLKQLSFSLVFARNKEHAHDWLIQMKSLFNALLCEHRLQMCEEGKAFCF